MCFIFRLVKLCSIIASSSTELVDEQTRIKMFEEMRTVLHNQTCGESQIEQSRGKIATDFSNTYVTNVSFN